MEALIWLIFLVVLGLLEAATVSLVCIWFALGSLAAFLAALLNAPFAVQTVICLVVGGVLLALTRPLARRYVNSKRVATNADRVLGQLAKVTVPIDNLAETGAVYVLGKLWTARSADGHPIASNAFVRVCRLEGVTLWVEPSSLPEDSVTDPASTAL